MSRLIGFAGRKGMGKDTCAEVLVSRLGYERFAFADCMKRICKNLFDFTDDQLHGQTKDTEDPRYGHSPRQLLQMFGSDFIRDKVSEEFWVGKFKKFMRERLDDDPPVVVSDVRFQNEIDVIKELGGRVFLIKRNSVEPTDEHQSESVESLTGFSAVICNDSSVDDLKFIAYQLGC